MSGSELLCSELILRVFDIAGTDREAMESKVSFLKEITDG